MKLSIDTSDSQKTIVGLGEKILKKESGLDKSQQVLILIDKILKDNQKSLKDIIFLCKEYKKQLLFSIAVFESIID